MRLLVIEGNTKADREIYREGFGRTAAESYVATLQELAPDAVLEICLAADVDATLPGGAALEDYDGVFVTGSALNLYDGGLAIERQIQLARHVFATRTPMFGSCWGLQLACAAAGGDVARNPRGREIGVAREIRPTEAGRPHPLMAGRAHAFEALCSHLDYVATAPPGSTVLAGNLMSEVQAIEIAVEGGLFWGVQYHPEFSLSEMAAIISRRTSDLTREGHFASEEAAKSFATGLRTLECEPGSVELAEQLGLGADILEPSQRRLEIVNFLQRHVRPRRSRRS